MKIKEVQAGIKITRNYNSYQASLTAELGAEEIPEKVGKELMEKALAIVNKNIGNEANMGGHQATSNAEIEVGAAWPDKVSEDRLSVKYSRAENWKDVNISDLEKTNIGYKQETNEGIFIFKKLSEEERTSDKMPTYRIYKVEKS